MLMNLKILLVIKVHINVRRITGILNMCIHIEFQISIQIFYRIFVEAYLIRWGELLNI